MPEPDNRREAMLAAVLNNDLDAQRSLLEGPSGPRAPILPPNDYGGRGDGMEPRIAKLEAHMEHVRSDLEALRGIPADVVKLTERVGHLPTKGYINTATVSALVLVAALSAFVQWVLSVA